VNSPAGSGEHADLDRLADLDAGLLDDAAAGELRRHLDSCVSCRDGLDRLRSVREMLQGLPDETIPDAVASRLDAAVAGEGVRAPTLLPSDGERRRRRLPTAAAIAAIAAGVLLIAGAVVGYLRTSDHTGSGAAAGPARSADLRRVNVVSTGRDYTPGNLYGYVQEVLHHAPASHPAGAAGTTGTLNFAAPIDPSLARVRGSEAALQACIAELSAGSTTGVVTPLGIDFAYWQGKPAIIVLMPGLSGGVDAWIAGSRCGTGSELPTYRQVTSPTPSPSPSR
jgi:hypothetical protein